MDWEIVYFSERVQEALLAFPPGLQARYIHLTERMLNFGPDLGMPTPARSEVGSLSCASRARRGSAECVSATARIGGS
jgi:hypothetical protein